MKKVTYIIILVCILGGIVNLNRSYSSIYQNISKADVTIPSDFQPYVIGSSAESLTYVAIGDSLTSGVGVDSYQESYPYALAKLISDKKDTTITLIPISVPGFRSVDVLDTLLDQVSAFNPDIITLLIGVNDVHGNVLTDTFQKTYKDILDKITNETDATVYLIGVPYIGMPKLISDPYKNYFMHKTKQFNEVIQELADEYDLKYIDLYELSLTQYEDNSQYSPDLFHLNAKGYAQWATFIYANSNI